MIRVTNLLIAESPVEQVWRFFNDIGGIARCVPTCIRYRVVDENNVDCDLRVTLGKIPLDATTHVTVIERSDNRRLIATGKTEAGEITKRFGRLVTGTVTHLTIGLDLEALDADRTRVRFWLEADAVGQMKKIYEAVLYNQRAKLEAQFIENLRRALGARITLDGDRPEGAAQSETLNGPA